MSNLTALIVGIVLLTGCASIDPSIKAYTAYHTAPHALTLLNGYVTDKAYQDDLAEHLEALQELHKSIKNADGDIVDFIRENPGHITQARLHWIKVVEIVGDYSQEANRPVPDELFAYRADVESAWNALIDSLNNVNIKYNVRQYGALLLKILAANQGVIIPIGESI